MQVQTACIDTLNLQLQGTNLFASLWQAWQVPHGNEVLHGLNLSIVGI